MALYDTFVNLFDICNIIYIIVFEYVKFILLQFFYSNHDKYKFVDNICLKMININILYIKIFQAIALNNSIINHTINNKLLKFTNNTPYCDNDIDYDVMDSLVHQYNITFDSYIPINSGMISLVFRGKMLQHENTLTSNEKKEIIIKIKRKNIDDKLKIDIDKLLFFAYLLNVIPIFKQYKFEQIINKNIKLIHQQLDFKNEIKNMNTIRQNCKNLKYIIVPSCPFENIADEYSNVIIMDYIKGVTIDNIDKNDKEEFAKQLIKFGAITTLLHGYSHGDLHSGNILFIKDLNEKSSNKYKLGIIDFGIAFIIKETFKNKMFEIMTNIFINPPIITAEQILCSGLIKPVELIKLLPKKHYTEIINMITHMLDEILTINNNNNSNNKVNQNKIFEFISLFNSYLSNNNLSMYGIYLSDDFVKTQLSLAMAQGVTLTLCGKKYIELTSQVINELFHLDLLK